MRFRRRDAAPEERERQRRIRVASAFRRRPPPVAEQTVDEDEPPPPSMRWGETAGETATLGIGGAVMPPQPQLGEELIQDTVEARPEAGDLAEHIRALEARLDGLLEDRGPATPRSTPLSSAPAAAPTPSLEVGPDDNVADATEADETADVDPVRRSPFYRRMWGSAGHRRRAGHVDEFGLDPDYEQRVARPLLEFLYRFYFRVTVDGIANVPSTGRCLIVANHSGTLPLDGPILRTALRRDHPSRRELRWLAEDFLYYLPFAGTTITRVGAVRACSENGERLLYGGHCVAVFPEGIRGISKLYRERYQLQRFGRGGFIRLALRTGAPIIPCAVVGAEETGPLLYREEMLSKWVGLPYLPVTPTFPWLGPVGLLPAPTRWSLYFGEPLHFAEYGPGAADDDVLVGRLAEHVRGQIQHKLSDAVAARKSVWFG